MHLHYLYIVTIIIFMSTCSFCRQPGHRIQHCDSQMISVFDKCIQHSAAYDYYLGLQTSYLRIYLISLDFTLLRAVGYTHNILFKKKSSQTRNQPYIPYNDFINKFILYYSDVSSTTHVELINSLSYNKITVYSEHIHQFLVNHNIHTNWTPSSISTILLSTRIFAIDLKIANDSEILTCVDNCAVCLENIPTNKSCKLLCNHYFCSPCILKYIEQLYKNNRDHPICPLCRSDITDMVITKIDYHNCVNQISKIKNIRRPTSYNDYYNNSRQFELRIEYMPIYITDHPQFERMKYAFFVVARMYVLLVYLDILFKTIEYLFKSASSFHNQYTLQI
jgi:hypothetical protein